MSPLRASLVPSAAFGLLLVVPPAPAAGEPLLALTSANQIVAFDSAAPGTVSPPVLVTGLAVGERLVGIDYRPRTGGLYGLGALTAGIDDSIQLYRIDPNSGAATAVGTPFPVLVGLSYGMDFNPTVDRIRVVNTTDENFRVNPNNGVRSDSPVNDTDLTPTSSLVDAVAYDRNFHQGFGGRTTLFAVSRAGNGLRTIGGPYGMPSPNLGQVTGSGAFGVSIGASFGMGLDVSPTTGTAYAVWEDAASGEARLHRIDLYAGSAAVLGRVGDGSGSYEGLTAVPSARLVFGPANGKSGAVRAFDLHEPQNAPSLEAFAPPVKGGVRVAAGDFNQDGFTDVVVAAGPGSPPIFKVFDGKTGTRLMEQQAYAPDFTGGVVVAAGDVNGDGFDDVITAPGPGIATEVVVWSGRAPGTSLVSFLPFGGATEGASVAAEDFDLTGSADIVVGSGPGLPPEVRVFDLSGLQLTAFAPYPPEDAGRGGVWVAAGRRELPTIATTQGKGSTEVVVFSSPNPDPLAFAETARFDALPGSSPQGLRVALLDANRDGLDDVAVVPGPGKKARCYVWDGGTQEPLLSFVPQKGSGAWIAGR
jgi:hypothetical protein